MINAIEKSGAQFNIVKAGDSISDSVNYSIDVAAPKTKDPELNNNSVKHKNSS